MEWRQNGKGCIFQQSVIDSRQIHRSRDSFDGEGLILLLMLAFCFLWIERKIERGYDATTTSTKYKQKVSKTGCNKKASRLTLLVDSPGYQNFQQSASQIFNFLKHDPPFCFTKNTAITSPFIKLSKERARFLFNKSTSWLGMIRSIKIACDIL